MAVRVKLKVKSLKTGKEIELVVLANGGAESEKPMLVVDPEIAKSLELYSYLLREAEIYEVTEASTSKHVYVLSNAVEIELIDHETGESLSKIVADLAVEEGLTEPLITDVTIDELGIQVISFSKGLWKHINDPPNKIRRSTV